MCICTHVYIHIYVFAHTQFMRRVSKQVVANLMVWEITSQHSDSRCRTVIRGIWVGI